MFTIELINGRKFVITDEECQTLLGKNGLVAIKSIGAVVNTASISCIISEKAAQTSDLLKDRSKQTHGVLSDGTKVIRQFGSWYVVNNELDDHGRYLTRPDAMVYREISTDIIASPEEWAKRGSDFYDKDVPSILLGQQSENPKLLDRPRTSVNGLSRI